MSSVNKKITERLRIGGMSCTHCQCRIEQGLRSTPGVLRVRVSYQTGTADITYDADRISRRDIRAVVEKLGYQVLSGKESTLPGIGRTAAILTVILSLYALLQRLGVLNLLVPSKLADTQMGYGMLFLIGLITSVHCIAMCGGINLSQCIPHGKGGVTDAGLPGKSRAAAFAPAFLYNLGRVISYTAIGFVLGLVGWLLGGESAAGVPVTAQGILKLAAGVCMTTAPTSPTPEPST